MYVDLSTYFLGSNSDSPKIHRRFDNILKKSQTTVKLGLVYFATNLQNIVYCDEVYNYSGLPSNSFVLYWHFFPAFSQFFISY
jgi:hypothetical protein